MQQYLEKQLLKKNLGVYFRKGKWVFHALCIVAILSVEIFRGRIGVPEKAGVVQDVFGGILRLLPFFSFFYIYCLYLIPVCFKTNRYRRFWTIFMAMLVLAPAAEMLIDLLCCRFLSVSGEYPVINWRYIFNTYRGFIINFMGFTSVLYLMELLESIRTSRQIDDDSRQRDLVEIQLVKTRMNPDYMVRSLDAIIHLSEAGDAQAPDAVIRFSDILRYRLYRSAQKLVPLHEELTQLDNLFRFHNSQPGHEGTAVLEVEGIPATGNHIAPLLLITLAEPLLTTYEADCGGWSLLLYLLLEEGEAQVAMELTGARAQVADAKLEAITADLHRLLPAGLNFTVDKDNTTYSIRTCLPLTTNSIAS